ncbi:3-isopropylmalate dehydratase [Pseudoalteromonas sp. NBT06-2]|uniref:aconitase family protein n=1 Tax=Pseudoalteromonas sp. NBT06-2 TaxID=2025950 RepID=UPI000BA50670|nr:aconitase family protein [Pseudoalteromonas sp. NBT06-2]PAJ75782.1 3-isopropylmalate dehydratase [Pseudoalteromonas sp. NBT06-2]
MSKKQNLKFENRFLFLTEDSEELIKQLNGNTLDSGNQHELINSISTDEITPGWTCFWYDETLGDYCLVGLRNGVIQKDTIKSAKVDVLVSGLSKGCGSSRETAPYSEKMAGVKLIIAKSFEKIYAQNCRNIGLLTSTDFSLLEKIEKGESISIQEFTKGLDPISTKIIEMGGLFKYNLARLHGELSLPQINTPKRGMTIAEKIIVKNSVNLETTQGMGSVKPGDAAFCEVDVRFSHDYVTAMLANLFYSNFGKDAKVTERESIFAFRDHLTFVGEVLSKSAEKSHLIPLAANLAVKQKEFCEEQGITLYDELPQSGSLAICHNAVLEDIALPGQLIIGTDSHTCTAGAIGAFAFGVGSTDMANAFLTKDVQLRVPSTIKIVVTGKLRSGVSAKDVILEIMSDDYFKQGKAIGQVMEYTGEGLKSFNIDERATLTNMAVEAGAMTGIVEADEITLAYLKQRAPLDSFDESQLICSDSDAEFVHQIEINLCEIEPTIALPGDPRNGVALSKIREEHGEINVDIAYGGSCTGGKEEDMDMYAEVFQFCQDKEIKVNGNVKCYIQFGSQKVKKYAATKGYLDLFSKVGVMTIEPSCGACINAGSGVSDHKGQVSISAINRNFPGRSGPGKVYLASPFTVAASAITGFVCGFNELKQAYS